MKNSLMLTALAAALAFGTLAQGAEPKVKVLSVVEDATQKTVLIGRNVADNMIVIFELEPAKAMWMQMDNPPKWRERWVGKGELFHVEIKLVDPKSKTRISYADVKFRAVNRDNKKKVSGTLHPMWGGSGLHYAYNSALAGDGIYEATITIGVPEFVRAPADKDMWMKPVITKFHFKLAGSKVTEVTEPAEETQK
ncbi:MAG: iron transporter [Betaproteobacteria bacterium]|nr:iron transporter [Betaproteobacteria bacterium]